MLLHEILNSLPVFKEFSKTEKSNERLEDIKNQQIFNIYNHGHIDSIIKNLSVDEKQFRVGSHFEIVESILLHFKNQIENNGLFKLLYEEKGGKLKHENTVQMLLFSVAQIYCIAHNLDISPETNSGSGCVDFKISQGYNSKVNVEIKYSTNPNLEHGLHSQLKRYNLAEQTKNCFYVIIRVDEHSDKVIKILEQSVNEAAHQKVIVIDGMFKRSASIK